jgi:hypothetical protein
MPAKKKTPFTSPYVFAKATFTIREPGSKYPTTVIQGSAWYSDCPVVLMSPDNFSEQHPDPQPRGWVSKVEQATAAPGEERATRRGAG